MAFETKGKALFNQDIVFARGVRTESDLPTLRLPEIAFAGRSNVGKSSLINALTGKSVARASNTPGRTQELNFFQVEKQFFWWIYLVMVLRPLREKSCKHGRN